MRLNIAICDDDKSFMENLEKMLISYSLQFDIDIHVDKYQNGSALLSAYDSSQSSPYQVLMLDIEMPGENGISIAEKIKHTKDFDGVYQQLPRIYAGFIFGSSISFFTKTY